MNTEFIVSISGPDRPGLVQEFAKMTHQAGGKWSHGKLIHLEGVFGCLFKVDIAQENAAALKKQFQAMQGFQVLIADPRAKPMPAIDMSLVVDAADRPGLVNDISRQLTDLEISIDAFECHRMGTVDSGTLFTGSFTLKVPADLDMTTVQEKLEELEGEMKIILQPATAPA